MPNSASAPASMCPVTAVQPMSGGNAPGIPSASVEVLPGPSSVLAALVASALPADSWRFAGFLPRKRGELRRLLEEPGPTLVAFESPRRVPATLAVPYKVFYVCLRLLGGRGHSGVCVCSELSEDGPRFMFVNFTVECGDKAHARGNGPKHQVVAVLRKLP